MSVTITRMEQRDPVKRAQGDIHFAEIRARHSDGGSTTRWVSRWQYQTDDEYEAEIDRVAREIDRDRPT